MIKDAEMSLVVGRRGSGKSHKVKAMLAAQYPHRHIVFDPQAEYGSGPFITCSSGGNLQRHIAERWDKDFRVAYVPPAGQEIAALDALAKFILQIQEPYRGNTDSRQITLVVEEMNLGYPVQQLPAQFDGMARICNQGRHSGVNVIGVTQRPAMVSSIFRGNIAEAFVFPLSWGEDRNAILQMLGREHADALTQLPVRRCLHWRDGAVTEIANG